MTAPAGVPPGSTTTSGPGTHAIAGAFMLQGVVHLLGLLLGVFSIAILTRSLGPERYGDYLTAFMILSIGNALTTVGLPIAIRYLLGRGDLEDSRVLSGVMGLRVVTGLVIFGLAPVIAWLVYPGVIAQTTAIGAFGFFFVALGIVFGGLFQKHLAVGRVAIAEMVSRLLTILLFILVWLYDLGPQAAMASTSVAQLASFLVLWRLARPFVKLRPCYDPVVWREVSKTGKPIAVTNFFRQFCNRCDIFVVRSFWPGDATGVYGFATKILMLTLSIPVMMMGLVLPHLTRSWREGDRASFRAYLQSTFDLLSLVILPLVTLVQLRAEPLAVLVGGPEFLASASILRIHVVTAALGFLSILGLQLAVVVQRQRLLQWPSVLIAGLTVAGYFLVVPNQGPMAAAWITLASVAINVGLGIAVAMPVVRMRPDLTRVSKAVIGCGVMAAVLSWLPTGGMVLDALLGLVLYVGLLLASRALRPREVRDMLAAMRKPRRVTNPQEPAEATGFVDPVP